MFYDSLLVTPSLSCHDEGGSGLVTVWWEYSREGGTKGVAVQGGTAVAREGTVMEGGTAVGRRGIVIRAWTGVVMRGGFGVVTQGGCG